MQNKNIIVIVLIALLVIAGCFFFRNRKAIAPIDDVISQTPSLPYQAGLPQVVENKRQEIYQAAQIRDYKKLASAAASSFSYSFGPEADGGFGMFIKNQDENNNKKSFDIISSLLKLPYALEDDIYVWPAVFVKSSEEWTNEDLNMLRQIASEEEIKGYREFGAYVGYRIGINKNGDWVYYIAGD